MAGYWLFYARRSCYAVFGKLKVRGNQKIAEYVQSGGVYFGICAGAYYASRNVFLKRILKMPLSCSNAG